MRRFALFGCALMLVMPAVPAQAGDGLDLGTLVGAGLGGVIGNQIGKGTGNTVATVAGVIIGGVAGHTVDRNWSSSRYRGYSAPVSTYAPEPVYYSYQPNYVAPPAPPPTVIYSQYNRYDDDDDDFEYRHEHRRGHHYGHSRQSWKQPVVYRQTTVVQNIQPTRYVAPPRYVEADETPYCREYTNRVTVGGRVQESYGTACLQPDGSWQIAD